MSITESIPDLIARLMAERDEARAQLATARAEALEEAAKHLERSSLEAVSGGRVIKIDAGLGPQIAAAIRALATAPTAKPPAECTCGEVGRHRGCPQHGDEVLP